MAWVVFACIAGGIVTLAGLWFVGTVVEVAFDRQGEDLRFEYTMFGSPAPILVAIGLSFTNLPAWAIFPLVPIGSTIFIAILFGLFFTLRYGGRIWTTLAEASGRKLREVVTDWNFHRNLDQ
jgi:hypothetical protein